MGKKKRIQKMGGTGQEGDNALNVLQGGGGSSFESGREWLKVEGGGGKKKIRGQRDIGARPKLPTNQATKVRREF